MVIGVVRDSAVRNVGEPPQPSLVLAAIGLYGVIAYRASLRTQEIGVRMALGAGRRAIFRDVVLHGLTIAVAGVAIGEVLAIPAIRALASVQAGIRPGTPSTHVAGAVIWVAVALVACSSRASADESGPRIKAFRGRHIMYSGGAFDQ